MGITAGHWLPKNKEFFDLLGIEVNFERLGILDVATIDEIKKRNRLNIRLMAKKAIKKAKKRFNRWKSLK